MLNDILFCLLGKTGGIFLETEQGFEINQKYNFLSDSEKELLNRIGEIGYKYSILDNFIKNYYMIFNKKLINSHFLLANNDQYKNQSYNPNNNNDNLSYNIFEKINNFKRDNTNQKDLNINYDSGRKLDNNKENAMDIVELVNNENDLINKNSLGNLNSNVSLNNNHLYNSNYQNNLSDFLMPICLTIKNFLNEYESTINEIESIFYNNLNLTVQYIFSRLNSYSYKFDKIFDFLQVIINENYKGGDLLNLIFNFSINGDSEIKSIFVDIFVNCNKILLNYITSWIINGSLATPEFFILSTNSIINQKSFLKASENMNINVNNNMQINHYLNNNENYFLKEFENSKLELESWNTNFYVEYSNIPTYFPQSLAEDILFIGKAIKVLNSKINNKIDNRISNKDISIFYSSLQKLNEVIFNKEENGINIINIELLTKILNLIKSATGKYLWRLIIQQNNFMKCLNAIKDIYLTFSGEFYYNFINKIKILLNLPFDKRIENEINEIHFKNSLKEVFNTDSNNENNLIYGKFKIKLISHGINYDFNEKNYVKDLINKKEIFLANFSYYDFNNCLRFTNTIYKSSPGAIWNMSPIDIDEEFNFNMNFTLKNFTKVFSNLENNTVFTTLAGNNNFDNNESNFDSAVKVNNNNNNNNFISNFTPNMNNKNINYENDILKNSLIKSIKKFPVDNNNNSHLDNEDLRLSRKKINNIHNLTINVIMHNSKNFQTKNIPSSTENLINYFNFEFSIKYDNMTNKPSEMDFTLKYINKTKKGLNIIRKNNGNINKKIENSDLDQGEFILQTKKFIITNTNMKASSNIKINNLNNIYLPSDFLANDVLNSFNINFKDNYCMISNENNYLDYKFHFPINDYFHKDKRKIFLGVLLKTTNIDIAVDLASLNFNVLSGEIYNENSNLILIDYNPPWPHNFIFNDNILKMYNLIFNLLFPLKTNLILLNNIWVEKKNLAKNEKYSFTNIDAVHSEFVCFLQNLISFFMFDILEIKFKNFISKCEDCKDFELIIKYHEEFLGEVISNSFIRSKKIMNIVFDILYTTRAFCNFLEITLNEINLLFLKNEENENDNEFNIEEKLERTKIDLERLRNEFHSKVNYLLEIFSKIKNSKYYSLISQLLIKLNFNSSIGTNFRK